MSARTPHASQEVDDLAAPMVEASGRSLATPRLRANEWVIRGPGKHLDRSARIAVAKQMVKNVCVPNPDEVPNHSM